MDSTAGVWKHTLSGLQAMGGQGGSPAVAPSAGHDPVFEQIAHAAAAGLEAHSDVASARVIIDGSRPQPEVRIDCELVPSGNLARIAELIDSSLLVQMETLLGTELTVGDVRIHHRAPQRAA